MKNVIKKGKNWISNHKKEVTQCIVAGSIFTTGVVLTSITKEHKIKELKKFNKVVYTEYLKEKANRINFEKICKEKDAFMNAFFSKLLREGISEGGKQLAYKRWSQA